jgi:hypothetical protein
VKASMPIERRKIWAAEEDERLKAMAEVASPY